MHPWQARPSQPDGYGVYKFVAPRTWLNIVLWLVWPALVVAYAPNVRVPHQKDLRMRSHYTLRIAPTSENKDLHVYLVDC
jgi:hypothetical protein